MATRASTRDRRPLRHYLKEWREYRGLSQPQLAELMGTTQQAISRYETGSRQLRVDAQLAAAKALGIPPLALWRAPEERSADDMLAAVDPAVRSEALAVLEAFLKARSGG